MKVGCEDFRTDFRILKFKRTGCYEQAGRRFASLPDYCRLFFFFLLNNSIVFVHSIDRHIDKCSFHNIK